MNIEEMINEYNEVDMRQALDDLTGEELDIVKLKNARKEEIHYIETRGIWEVVPVKK